MFAAFGFLIGMILGSFFNVVVIRGLERAELGEKCKGERSECPKCGHKLSPLDLVPIFSWLWLRGKCRYCKEPISWIYPVGEAMTAIGMSVLMWKFSEQILQAVYSGIHGMTEINEWFNFAVVFVTICMFSISAISDFKEQEIYMLPVWICTGITITLRTVQCVVEYMNRGSILNTGYIQAFDRILMYIGFAVILWGLSIVLRNKMGGADFWFIFAMFVVDGFSAVFNGLFIGSIVGLIVIIGIYIKNKKIDRHVPMIPMMYAGFIIQMVFRFLEF